MDDNLCHGRQLLSEPEVFGGAGVLVPEEVGVQRSGCVEEPFPEPELSVLVPEEELAPQYERLLPPLLELIVEPCNVNRNQVEHQMSTNRATAAVSKASPCQAPSPNMAEPSRAPPPTNAEPSRAPPPTIAEPSQAEPSPTRGELNHLQDQPRPTEPTRISESSTIVEQFHAPVTRGVLLERSPATFSQNVLTNEQGEQSNMEQASQPTQQITSTMAKVFNHLYGPWKVGAVISSPEYEQQLRLMAEEKAAKEAEKKEKQLQKAAERAEKQRQKEVNEAERALKRAREEAEKANRPPRARKRSRKNDNFQPSQQQPELCSSYPGSSNNLEPLGFSLSLPQAPATHALNSNLPRFSLAPQAYFGSLGSLGCHLQDEGDPFGSQFPDEMARLAYQESGFELQLLRLLAGTNVALYWL